MPGIKPAKHPSTKNRLPILTWIVLAAAVLLAMVGSGVYAAQNPTEQVPPAASAKSTSPIPTATKTAEPVGDVAPLYPSAPTAPDGDPSVPSSDRTASGISAAALLETLPVKGRAPKTGYDRVGQFGMAWLDVDRNGCDTRNDMLARDLNPETKAGGCKVLTGILHDPYTGKTINFVRGNVTSMAVQIDHVVALMNAWETGAQRLTAARRVTLANDPMNLFAVDGPTNGQKGAGDAATWLPPQKSFRCEYVAHQVSVKATYGLWVTQAEHDAIAKILSTCPDQRAFNSVFAPVPVMAPTSSPVPAPAPAPASSVVYANCAAVRAAGRAPLYAGQPGYAVKLDGDKDGVACE